MRAAAQHLVRRAAIDVVDALEAVKVEDADVTDEIFTRLMGDVVEPRREFIQDNALNVAKLNI